MWCEAAANKYYHHSNLCRLKIRSRRILQPQGSKEILGHLDRLRPSRTWEWLGRISDIIAVFDAAIQVVALSARLSRLNTPAIVSSDNPAYRNFAGVLLYQLGKLQPKDLVLLLQSPCSPFSHLAVITFAPSLAFLKLRPIAAVQPAED